MMSAENPAYDPEFQEIAAFAAEMLAVPIALVSALGEDRQTFFAEVGFGRSETTLEESFGVHAVDADGVFEVPDALTDPRFAANPLVVGEPRVRFCAGVPIASPDGVRRGVLCVLGPEPRTLTDAERRTLAFLARQAETRLTSLNRSREAARTEAARRASEIRYRTLFESMNQGFGLAEVLVGEDGRPDFRWREVNPQFEPLTGLAPAVILDGRSMREIAPRLEDEWFRRYAAVAETGVADRFESHSDVMGRTFDVFAFPQGDHLVGVLFNDVTVRRADEAALRESEEHYRTLFASIDDGFCTFEMVFDEVGRPVDYRFLEVNDAFVAQTGLSRESALGGRTIREMVPNHEPAWFERYGRVAKTGEPLRIEDRAKGLGRWYEIHAFRIGGEGSREVGAIFKDVSARHEATRMLGETLRTAGVATYDWDVPGDLMRGNDLFAEFFGVPNRPEGNSIGLYFESMHPDDRERVGEQVQTALATGERYEMRYRVRGTDGRERWIVARGEAALGADGRPDRLFGVILDETAEVEADRALAAERARQDRTLEDAEVATFDWDLVRDRIWGNDRLALFFGIPGEPGGAPTEPYFSRIHDEDLGAMRGVVERAFAGEVPYEVQYRVLGADRRLRTVLARGEVTRDETGGPLRLSGVLVDVTEQVRAETSRQESERKLRVALRGGRMGTWDVDLRTGAMVCSDTCKTNYGRRPDEPFSYQDLAGAVLEEDRLGWSRAVELAIERVEDFETEYRVVWPDGTHHWVQVRGSCVTDAEGRVVGLSGVSFDVTERARVEAERERLLVEVEMEQARLRAIFEQAPAIIAVLRGRDLVFDYVNEGYYQTTGHRPMIGLTLEQALPEAVGGGEGRDYDRVLRHVFDTGERSTFSERPVFLQRTPGGPLESRYLDLAYLPLRESDGAISGVLVHGVDVTENVLARRAVAEREELFRTVFEQAPDDAILVMGRDRTLTAWNPAAERITGWTAVEAIGQSADLIFPPPEDRASGAPAQETEGAARDGKAADERWHMRRDGSRFWGSGTMNALHDAAGNVTGFLKVFRDATARHEEASGLAFLTRLTDAAVRQRAEGDVILTCERMLGEHLGVSRVAFAEASADGTTVSVREEWAPGLPSLAGTHVVADFGEGPAADFVAGRVHVSRDAEREYAPGAGLEAVRATGAISGLSVPILRSGRFAALLVVHHREARDWTEAEIALARQTADRMLVEADRARAEAALREANRTLEGRVESRTAELAEAVQQAEGFNYSISHDLRAPLRAIVSTASILRDELGPELEEEYRDLLERQVHNASRMGRLIDELLRLSRYSRVEVKRQPLDMTAKARSVAEGLGECAVEVQEGMRAMGDPELVRTVLDNLIGNACKFSPNGGTVRVRQEGKVFAVSDEGVGFDMAFAPKIFLPFERLVGDREFEGTGIGLANVKRIVERHGGRVWAESEPGKGATFFFTLSATDSL